MEGIQHKTVPVNGLNIHIAEMGQGPIVLLIHGYPELWYSWRHQITHLAAHGYRAVAPDLRGYGDTTGVPTDDHSKFSMFHVVGDLVALIDAIKESTDDDHEEKVFVVGHDWGALIAWQFVTCRPDKVKALVNLSVPFLRRHPEVSPVENFRRLCGDDFYICRFQAPGLVEAGLATIGTRAAFRKFILGPNAPDVLPSWLSEEDVDYYVSKFEKTGFIGGVNYYRAWNLSWEFNAPWNGAQVKVPTKFITGNLDLVYHFPGFKEYIHSGEFKKDVPLLEEAVVMENVGHFINQEKPDEINKYIVDFFSKF